SALNKMIDDLAFFEAVQQNPISGFERAARAPDLLIIVNDRTGKLVMDHKREVRFVEAHAERRRRDQNFDPIFQQALLDLFANTRTVQLIYYQQDGRAG